MTTTTANANATPQRMLFAMTLGHQRIFGKCSNWTTYAIGSNNTATRLQAAATMKWGNAGAASATKAWTNDTPFAYIAANDSRKCAAAMLAAMVEKEKRLMLPSNA